MPKKKTARQRDRARRQQQFKEAERQAAAQERFREGHARLIAERTDDPRFVQQRRGADGERILAWHQGTPADREIRAALEEQKRAFRAKFGRDPGPADPVFFDPDADEPVPLALEHFDESLDELARAAESGELEVDPALIRAWQELGYILTEENMHLFSAEEVATWYETVERHRDELDM